MYHEEVIYYNGQPIATYTTEYYCRNRLVPLLEVEGPYYPNKYVWRNTYID
ncbi:MAG: hypothetical protein FWE01_02500 [Firmicutes bacterium]|nr:hypothetical protein [Bacillota bacterium]